MSNLYTVKKDTKSCIAACASMSPSARQAVDQYLYLYRIDEDDVDNDAVLRELITNILVDLRTIGVVFNLSVEDLSLSDSSTVDFINLCYILLPNTLYPALRSSDSLKTLLTGIVDGSLGENEPAINTYLKELIGFDTGLALVPELTTIIELLLPGSDSSEIFMTYLKTLLDDLETERMMPDVDPNHHNQFISMIRGWQWDAVNFAANVELLVNEPALTGYNHIVKRWVSDLLDPDHLVWNMYLFLTDPNTLPEGIRKRYEIRKIGYMASCPLFVQYYTERNTTKDLTIFTDEKKLILILGCITRSNSELTLQKELEELPFYNTIADDVKSAAQNVLISRGTENDAV